MLSLFVYNRNRKNAERLNERCLEHIKNTGKHIGKNVCCEDPVKLVSMIQSFDEISLYMLKKDDTKLEKIAENIRLANDGNYIVLVLQSADEMFDAVTPSVRPSGLLLEDSEDRRLHGLLDEIFADHERMSALGGLDSYRFKSNGIEYSTSFSSVMLIEVQSKKIKMYTDSQVFEFYDSLDAVMNRAPDYFLRVHRSFVVNTNYIKEVNYKEKTIFMKNESQLFFSRTYSSNIKEYFKNTLKENYF